MVHHQPTETRARGVVPTRMHDINVSFTGGLYVKMEREDSTSGGGYDNFGGYDKREWWEDWVCIFKSGSCLHKVLGTEAS